MVDKMRIEVFLKLVKAVICDGILILSEREKNIGFLSSKGISIQTIKKCILELSVCNYCSGPSSDKSTRNRNDVWVFGVVIESIEIYIKLSFGDSMNKVVCVSFHEAEFPMVYPYGGKNEQN